MKRITTLISRKAMLLFALFLLIGTITQAQLKIGANPSTMQKASILELESSRQGLLLPRLVDTNGINALTPPDGMIIYLTADNSLRLRSNGAWKKIADLAAATANWSLSGNSGIDSATNFIGTVDGKPLAIKTNGTARLHVGSNGNVGIGTTTPSATLDVNGTVKLESIANGTNEVQVLVLQNDGSVVKRTMSSAAFENAIRAINGIQWQDVKITAAASDTALNVGAQTRTSDSTIAIYLPVQNGSSASKPYGLLSYADWQKIHSGLQELAIGAVSKTPDVNAATITITDTLRTIVLHAADATHAGIVTDSTQTFGGDKTFAGNVITNGNLTVNGTLNLGTVSNNNSADSVLVYNNGLIQKRAVSSAAFGNAIRSINGNSDTAQVFTFKNAGSDLSVSISGGAGTDSVYLNVPDAATSARGVVTTIAQAFAGTKSFRDSILIGGTGAPNSTAQLSGSVSLAIRTITASDNATATDNTILANTTSAPLTVTLPTAGGITGRIYTIKKVGTGDVDNPLTINPSGGAKIEGGTTYVIYNDWTYVTLQTDGSNWYIIKK